MKLRRTTSGHEQLLLAFYGDDFTGSTDALESLVLNGIPTMLFLRPPSAEEFRERYPHLQAMGIAGEARSMTPIEMKKELPDVFSGLAALAPLAFHYKACSTFDSAPTLGNLGVAMELAAEAFRQPSVHALGGAPHLGRYLVFGHLFARYGSDGQVFRIDRHPVMRQHPSTPMSESDLAVHLGKQTDAFDVESLYFEEVRQRASNGAFGRLSARKSRDKKLTIFDAVTQEDVEHFGNFVLEVAQESDPAVLLGPSSVESALGSSWREAGNAQGVEVREQVGAAEPVLVLSGSCSSVTAQQIQCAAEAGFARLTLDPQDLPLRGGAQLALQQEVTRHLGSGTSVVVATCHGHVGERDSKPVPAKLVGDAFSALLQYVMDMRPPKRIVLAGGDTSSHTLKRLPVVALEMVAPIDPGVPLCKLYGPDPRIDGMEIALKGGQLGSRDFLVRLRDGSG